MRMRVFRWLSAHRYPLLAGAIITAAVAIRVGLASQGWPGTDSDDSTMGLMAKHILVLGERPIFFYGQSYMGTIEAYLGALMFALLGVSSFALRCGLILLYAAFMAAMYLLLSQAFDKRWALVGLLLLSVGDDDMLYHQLEAYGGYLETLLFGALLILLTGWLIRTSADLGHQRWRSWCFLGWGLVAGLGLWSDPLVAPFVAGSALFLVLLCGRELRRWMGAFILAGFFVGISPWIIYIAEAHSLSAATSFLQHGTRLQTAAPTPAPHTSTTTSPAPPPRTLPAPGPGEVVYQHVLGTVVISVPNNVGATALCPLTLATAWPPQRWTSPNVQRCIAIRGIWGGGFLFLLALAFALEFRAFMTLRSTWSDAWTTTQATAAARGASRLVALGAPAVTVVLFAVGGASSFAPYQYARYLIGLAIAVPAVCATLWERGPSLSRFLPKAPRPDHAARAGSVALTAVLAVTLIAGTLATYSQIPSVQRATRQQEALVDWLIQHDDTRIYSDYWTCIRTIFQSNERIVCSVVGGQLQPMPNRYAPYDALVRASPYPAYVFEVASSPANAFAPYAAQQGWTYTRSVVNGQYVVFRVLLT